jgi:large subunit ribosomal protein L19
MSDADQALHAAGQISMPRFATYLVSKGWRDEGVKSGLRIFSKELDGADQRVFAILPTGTNSSDRVTRIAAALRTFSEAEELPIQAILDDLEYPEAAALLAASGGPTLSSGPSPGELAIEVEQQKLVPRELPEFGPGDTVIVSVKVFEGGHTRVQAYEGVCIGRSGGGLNESFTVRKISFGEGVERVFPVMSPMIESIQVVRRGKVRRVKMYYARQIRGLKGKLSALERERVAEEDRAESTKKPASGGARTE